MMRHLQAVHTSMSARTGKPTFDKFFEHINATENRQKISEL